MEIQIEGTKFRWWGGVCMSKRVDIADDVELGAPGDTIKEGRFLFNRKTGKLFFDDLDKRVLLNPTPNWEVETGPG